MNSREISIEVNEMRLRISKLEIDIESKMANQKTTWWYLRSRTSCAKFNVINQWKRS